MEIKSQQAQGPELHSSVPFGVPVDPWITNMVTQGAKSSTQGNKIEPQGIQIQVSQSAYDQWGRRQERSLQIRRGAKGEPCVNKFE